MTYQARVVGPSEGTTRYERKFEEAYLKAFLKKEKWKLKKIDFECIPKVRNRKTIM
jgi:hypothetical protein